MLFGENPRMQESAARFTSASTRLLQGKGGMYVTDILDDNCEFLNYLEVLSAGDGVSKSQQSSSTPDKLQKTGMLKSTLPKRQVPNFA